MVDRYRLLQRAVEFIAMINAIDSLPRQPQAPDPLDCCGEGCVRCIHDIHEEAMHHYNYLLAAWKLRHPGAGPMSGTDEGEREDKPR